MNIVYLGNIWEYPLELGRIKGVQVLAIFYEHVDSVSRSLHESASDLALRTSRKLGAQAFRVSSDEEIRLAMESIGPIDLGIMANFGIILSQETLSAPKSGIVNFHPGLLPEQAGRTPVARLLKAGGGTSGLTIHRVTAQVDAGPVLFVEPGRVDPALSLEANVLALFRLGLPRLADVIFPR